MEDVDSLLNRHLTIAERRQERRFAAAIAANQPIATAAIQLEKGVLQKLNTEECYGEVFDFCIARSRMDGEGPCAGSCISVDASLHVEAEKKQREMMT